MATNTYVALDKVTVGTATPSITFSSIPSTYTDLVIVVGNFGMNTAGSAMRMRFNGDTASNYSDTFLVGDGSTATSGRESSVTSIRVAGLSVGPATTNTDTVIIQVQNYSNATTYKTALIRDSSSVNEVGAVVGLWRSTAAITSITLVSYNGTHNILAGSTFSLYGIAAASVGAKATGGVISSDSQYYYHTFLASGTFTPDQSLTCDYLVVAGGGGGSCGGGGAGGYLTSIGGSPLSVTAQAYSITVGSGGAGAFNDTNASNGTNSIFSTITSTGGGGGAGGGSGVTAGLSGGSGGGAGAAQGATTITDSGGAASPSGQGNAGGSITSVSRAGAGGGGAGAVGGSTSTNSVGGNGGAGSSSSITGSAVTRAGGGGAGGASTSGTAGSGGGGTGGTDVVAATSGTVNTGSGGGGGRGLGSTQNGGSGIVIVRYAK
jgi:hypothetical protein